MAPEKPLEFSPHARRFIAARGITEAHVRYCRERNTLGYDAGGFVVWACILPDGRHMKVKAKEGEHTFYILQAFSYGNIPDEERNVTSRD